MKKKILAIIIVIIICLALIVVCFVNVKGPGILPGKADNTVSEESPEEAENDFEPLEIQEEYTVDLGEDDDGLMGAYE